MLPWIVTRNFGLSSRKRACAWIIGRNSSRTTLLSYSKKTLRRDSRLFGSLSTAGNWPDGVWSVPIGAPLIGGWPTGAFGNASVPGFVSAPCSPIVRDSTCALDCSESGVEEHPASTARQSVPIRAER